MKKNLFVLVIAICLLVSCAPTVVSAPVSTPTMTPTLVSVTPTPVETLPTLIPTIQPSPTSQSAMTTLSRDELPTKTWPDLESTYACNDEERKDPKTNYPWELSMPLSADTLLYYSEPWTVAKKSEGVFTIHSRNINSVFEIRSDDYAIGTPEGVGVYRINFTTKVCENDWLFVIMPEANSFDFPITVIFK